MTNYRCTISGLLGGVLPWSTRVHYSGAMGESTLNTSFGARVATLWNTATNGLENFMSADVTMTATTVSTLNSTMHQVTKSSVPHSIAGTDANASLPWNIAEIITLRSTLAQKTGKGRMYLPPFAEDQVVAHVIIAATTAKMKIVFDAFFAGMTADGATRFVYNDKTLKNGTLPYTITDSTYYDIPDKPGQQRRRVSKLQPTRVIGVG